MLLEVIFGVQTLLTFSFYPNPKSMKYFSMLFFLLFFSSGFAQTAPDFTITTSDGQTRSLYADYLNQGKTVVIEAFFTTCPPCNAHAPFWQTLYENQLAMHPEQVEFILLSTLQTDSNTKVAQYKTTKGLSMPGAGANGGSITALQPYMTGQFGDFQGTPTFILIQPNGEVVFDIRGASPQATMDLIAQNITTALAQICTVTTPFGTPISNVQISAMNTTLTANMSVSGEYSLANLPQLQNTSYTISATKVDDNPTQGLTTFDLVKISQHILGLDTFTQAWQFAASDMNCNNLVSTFDVVIGRKLILGIDENFPCNTWKFIPLGSAIQFNGACVDLQGVRLGDVTGPYLAPPASERTAFTLYADNRYLSPGERYTLKLSSKEWMAIQSLQLQLDIDPASLQISHIAAPQLPGFDATCYKLPAADEKRLSLLWLDGNASKLYPGLPMISIELTALQAGYLSDMLRLHVAPSSAEMYDKDLRLWNLDLQWQNTQQQNPLTGNIFPNPARNAFQVYYENPTEVDLFVQLIDLQGKIVLEKTFPGLPGENWLELLPENASPGLHVIKINGHSQGNIFLNP